MEYMSYFMEVSWKEAGGTGKEAFKPCESESRHAIWDCVPHSPNSELWSCSLAEDREPLIRNPPNADAVVKNLNLTFEAVQDSECDILKAQIKMKLVCMDLALDMSTLRLYHVIPQRTEIVFSSPGEKLREKACKCKTHRWWVLQPVAGDVAVDVAGDGAGPFAVMIFRISLLSGHDM